MIGRKTEGSIRFADYFPRFVGAVALLDPALEAALDVCALGGDPEAGTCVGRGVGAGSLSLDALTLTAPFALVDDATFADLPPSTVASGAQS